MSASQANTRAFTDPLFEKLELRALTQEYERLRALSNPSPSERAALAQVEYFTAEALGFRGRIHEQNFFLERLSTKCESYDKSFFDKEIQASEAARLASTCALLYSESFLQKSPFSHAHSLARKQFFLAIAKEKKVTQVDRFYIEGRVYYRIPALLGRRLGKSLLSFHFLRKMLPEASSVDFWLGRIYQLQGNETQARDFFQKALKRTPPDTRALLYFGGEKFVRKASQLDGLSYGISPALFYTPNLGFGGQLVWRDDRMFDLNRSIRLALAAGTRSYFRLNARYEDRELLETTSLGLRFDGGQWSEDFFGLGIGSSENTKSSFLASRLRSEFFAQRWFWDSFSFQLGWRFAYAHIRDPSGTTFLQAPLPDKVNSFHTGPFAAFEYDDRDSFQFPRRGQRFRLAGYFPTQAFGSERSFNEWDMELTRFFPLALRHHFRATVRARWLDGSPPYAAFVKLGGSFELPGVERYRYQDRALMVGFVDYRYQILDSLSLWLFSDLGTVASGFTELFQSAWKAGVGGGFWFHPYQYHRPVLRVELGLFGSEVNFRTLGGFSF